MYPPVKYKKTRTTHVVNETKFSKIYYNYVRLV